MFKINGTNMALTRGDTLKLDVTIKAQDGTIYTPIAGDTIVFALGKDPRALPLLTIVIPYNTMQLVINPSDTEDLDFGTYVYDMQITKFNGDVHTFIPMSKFDILEEVAR